MGFEETIKHYKQQEGLRYVFAEELYHLIGEVSECSGQSVTIYYEEEHHAGRMRYRALKGFYVKSDSTIDEEFLVSGRCEPQHTPKISDFDGMIDHIFDYVNDDLYHDERGYLVGPIKHNAPIGLYVYALEFEDQYEETE